MAWHLPHDLGGPVLHWELVRAARRPVPLLLRYGIPAWLAVQFFFLLSDFQKRPEPPERYYAEYPQTPLQRGRASFEVWRQEGIARNAFTTRYVSLLLRQQLLLILILVP